MFIFYYVSSMVPMVSMMSMFRNETALQRRVLTDRVCISHDDGGGDAHGGRLQTVSPEGLLPEANPGPLSLRPRGGESLTPSEGTSMTPSKQMLLGTLACLTAQVSHHFTVESK
ncbi:hypothetical protein CDAR_445391 [Caerostris darwini]|uniref:Uncharacterized protein n=1 Tax=Caerostris darwini TaxID=1538125 RepID=A0AAV4SBM9_9ARAC|nr:hypothetical protein CDAR_445391 [Caerostris darwini]